MKLTSIGHASWLISTPRTNIIVDPILDHSFGTHADYRFFITPERAIALAEMPSVDAVVLTSEHLQHFHLPSLLRLSERAQISSVPLAIYVPPLIPSAVTGTLEAEGMRVIRTLNEQSSKVGDLSLRFFMADAGTLNWDRRGCSIIVSKEGEEFIFIQSDIAIPESVFNFFGGQAKDSKSILVLTNNFRKSSCSSRAAALDNALPVVDPRYRKLAGLRLLDELLASPLKKIKNSNAVVLAGNGFVEPRGRLVPAWSNRELTYIANALSLDKPAHCLLPGDCYDLKNLDLLAGHATWIQLTDRRVIPSSCHHTHFVDLDQPDLVNPIIAELNRLAKAWIISSYGTALMQRHRYLGKPTGVDRLALQMTTGIGRNYQFNLNVSTNRFSLVPYEGEEAMRNYPFGIIVDLREFQLLQTGKLQIWEVVCSSASQWYVCDRYESPLAFLLEYYSEHIDQERARLSYRHSKQETHAS